MRLTVKRDVRPGNSATRSRLHTPQQNARGFAQNVSTNEERRRILQMYRHQHHALRNDSEQRPRRYRSNDERMGFLRCAIFYHCVLTPPFCVQQHCLNVLICLPLLGPKITTPDWCFFFVFNTSHSPAVTSFLRFF